MLSSPATPAILRAAVTPIAPCPPLALLARLSALLALCAALGSPTAALGSPTAALGSPTAALGCPAAAQAPTGPSSAPPSAAASTGITQILIEGQLDVGALSLVRRAADHAAANGNRLVVVLNTPGGQVDLMWKIARALGDASERGIFTVAWVNDHAVSAGALVALACDRIYMRRTGQIGSAAPVVMTPGGVSGLGDDPVVREKTYSSLRSDFHAWAENHGRPGLLAQAMVDSEIEVVEIRRGGVPELLLRAEYDDLLDREGAAIEFVRVVVRQGTLLNLVGPQAVELGVADGLAESAPELYEKIGAAGAEPFVLERQLSEELASWLDAVAGLLLLVGLALAWIELKNPGFGIPGIGSILCFGLLLFGRYLVGLADILPIVAVVVGLGLVGVELFVLPGTLWFGLGGVLLLLYGLIGSNLGPSIDLVYGLDRELALNSAWRTVLFTSAALGAILLLSRFLPDTPVLRGLVLQASGEETYAGAAMQEAGGERAQVAQVGEVGQALTDLRPVGKVCLDARPELDWEARTEGVALDAGARVRVLEVRAGRLVVGALDDAPLA